jgi:NAD(P)-dependent dehydrogenase (short-subunit alcohol dehydrogenase family)
VTSLAQRWFITGCSDGLGRSIAEAALTAGHDVIATARDTATLVHFAARFGGRVTPLPLDVTDAAQAGAAVAAVEQGGGIDVLVNNAGHGYLAAVEEGEDDKIRRTFEVNFHAVARLIRLALPAMRARGSGAIVNIGSIAGIVGGAGSAYYSAAKFAVEGLSDALAAEVAPLGIRVLMVEPGPIRTSFAGRALLESPHLQVYAATAGARQQGIRGSDGRQSGDPDAIARLIVETVDGPPGVSRLVLGAAAIGLARRKIAALAADLDAVEAASCATDHRD